MRNTKPNARSQNEAGNNANQIKKEIDNICDPEQILIERENGK